MSSLGEGISGGKGEIRAQFSTYSTMATILKRRWLFSPIHRIFLIELVPPAYVDAN
jgi:hypothetical protein